MAKEQNKGQSIPVSINTFHKGMNKDISKYAMPADQYYDANNIRIVANSGQEGAALVNIEGNDHLVNIPDSPAVWELRLNPNLDLDGVVWAFTLLFNAGTWGTFEISLTGTGGNPIRTLASTLEDTLLGTWDLNGVPLTNPGPPPFTIPPSSQPDGLEGFFYIFDESSNRLIIWGKPVESDFQVFPNSGTNYNGSQVQQISAPIFSVMTLAGVGANFMTITNLAVPQSSLSIIGYASLREQIYLFTTNTEGDGGPGQIWRLYVNPSIQSPLGITSYIECVYARNNCMNFTKQHPIEALGRYEKKDIQSVYWTDFYNPPRKLNVASGISMSTPCAFLDLAPKTGFSIPVLDRITIGGSLNAGLYQLTYRYKSSEGISTEWSPLSNLVPIYDALDDNPYCEIIGDTLDTSVTPTIGKETTKRIDWTINGLDTSFELIEVAAVYKKDDIPANDQIFIFGEYINGSVDLTVTLTGNEVEIPITAVDFITGLGATFEKVKTLDTKDNKLFFGNIENSTFIVDFDARAYRFNAAQVADLDSVSEASISVSNIPAPGTITPDLVPETHDCINPFNDENPTTNSNWFTNDQYQFQSDGVTLGGEGVNVSYQFVTEQDVGDSQRDQPNTDNAYQTFYTDLSCNVYNTSPTVACFINPAAFGGALTILPAFLTGTENLGIAVQNYEMNSSFNTMKSPYKWSLYGSYARGEVYRFGIVFYNNKGQASFVNWIGDIRIPFSYSSGLGTPLGTFAVSNWVPDFTSPTYSLYTDNANTAQSYQPEGQIRLNQIGIQFTVDLSNIAPEVLAGITGYSIVRCDRKEKDKSRFGTALAHTVDRLDMRGSKWNSLSPPANYSWRVDNKQSVLIPSTGNLALPCGGNGLSYCDGGPGGGDTCDMPAWNDATWNVIAMNDNPYWVCKTRKTELLLYGALGWHNSDLTEEGNLNEGLETTFPIKKGDYIKIDQVYFPHFNATMGLNNFAPTSTGAGLPNGYYQKRANHWYKYYVGVNLVGGIFGSVQSTQIDYSNGVIANNNGMDPANNRYSLEWGTWVPDGGYIENTSVPSLQWPFMNVTNPAWAGLMDVMNFPNSLSYTWMWNRPMSIGSETLFLRFEEDGKEWTGADHIMGASVTTSVQINPTPAQFQAVPTRSTFSYERYNTPYGGPTYAARTYSEYMSTGHYVPINSSSNLNAPFINSVFGGDVQCQIFDYTQFEKNWGQTDFDNYDSITASGGSGAPEDADWGSMRACMVPLECHYKNILWRHGYHFSAKATNSGSYPNTGISLHDEYLLNEAYNAQNNVRTYFPLPLSFSRGDEFDTRIYYSQTKINGEPSDSWSVFLIDNYKDVEGVYGPINKLVTLHDTMYYFQDTGFGALSVNPTAMVQAADGTALQLGTISSGAGAFIQSYQYISTQFGSSQQWAVTKSDNAIYFFDIKARKLFNYSSKGTTPLSDITGLHSFFTDELRGDVLTNDNPIMKKGISSTYDPGNSEALFTFHDAGYTRKYDQTIIQEDLTGVTPNRIVGLVLRNVPGGACNPCFNTDCEEFAFGDLASFDFIVVNNILVNGKGPFMGVIVGKVGCPNFPTPNPNTFNWQAGDLLLWIPEGWNTNPGFQPDNVTFDDLWAMQGTMQIANMECGIGTKSTTIAYNELIQGFTSFYDFTPSIYITTPQFMITPNTQNVCESDIDIPGWKENQLYLHNVGAYGKFYDVIYPSSVTLISNLESAATKVFDNVSFHMESLWEVGRAESAIGNQSLFGANRITGLYSGNPNIKPIDIKDNTFDKIRFYTDYQITDYIDVTPGTNIKKKEREWQMAVPRNVMDENIQDADIFNVFNYDASRQHKDRLRDKYMLIDLIYNNYNTEVGEPRNIKFVLHYFKTFFRPSYR
ncbi:MAG: hypothetical protein Unbinned838contig1000_4 [Prokaryotic dsDNA virus sp.]|nr:MAG: hypothetical protein Unbinned838contig1000_4 [Prokaryotic dsDNA virus sp.]|tara:strand:+ start:7724 stop:13324 length:5601 start_codon:yes stop_codon:yes gene_type:complete